MRRNIAMPIPPTFASMPNSDPSSFPASRPKSVQIPRIVMP